MVFRLIDLKAGGFESRFAAHLSSTGLVYGPSAATTLPASITGRPAVAHAAVHLDCRIIVMVTADRCVRTIYQHTPVSRGAGHCNMASPSAVCGPSLNTHASPGVPVIAIWPRPAAGAVISLHEVELRTEKGCGEKGHLPPHPPKYPHPTPGTSLRHPASLEDREKSLCVCVCV